MTSKSRTDAYPTGTLQPDQFPQEGKRNIQVKSAMSCTRRSTVFEVKTQPSISVRIASQQPVISQPLTQQPQPRKPIVRLAGINFQQPKPKAPLPQPVA